MQNQVVLPDDDLKMHETKIVKPCVVTDHNGDASGEGPGEARASCNASVSKNCDTLRRDINLGQGPAHFNITIADIHGRVKCPVGPPERTFYKMADGGRGANGHGGCLCKMADGGRGAARKPRGNANMEKKRFG